MDTVDDTKKTRKVKCCRCGEYFEPWEYSENKAWGREWFTNSATCEFCEMMMKMEES